MGAPVMHWEINSRNAGRIKEFYKGLFGWQIQDVPSISYGLVDTGAKMGIMGGIAQVEANEDPFVTIYAQVENPDAYLMKAVALGARVIVPVTEIPDMVTFAIFEDPDGNRIGIIKGAQAPPPAKRSALKRRPPSSRKKSVPASGKRKGTKKRH